MTLDEDWPVRLSTPPEDETEVLAPAGEGSRADEIREKARAALDPGESATMIVLAILEVSAAIDRLTAEVRKKGD